MDTAHRIRPASSASSGDAGRLSPRAPRPAIPAFGQAAQPDPSQVVLPTPAPSTAHLAAWHAGIGRPAAATAAPGPYPGPYRVVRSGAAPVDRSDPPWRRPAGWVGLGLAGCVLGVAMVLAIPWPGDPPAEPLRRWASGLAPRALPPPQDLSSIAPPAVIALPIPPVPGEAPAEAPLDTAPGLNALAAPVPAPDMPPGPENATPAPPPGPASASLARPDGPDRAGPTPPRSASPRPGPSAPVSSPGRAAPAPPRSEALAACRATILRAQLGEALGAADRQRLRDGCGERQP
ncbi:hypothetical protein [Pseudoroseomonas sp. WGS1072]|uniref:hypothetical protein n=1 Tax=Roseomonas sp. WGS1072 TaxID=3366816 RepID=UPI003BF1C57C